jgi:hypothetical protein
MMGSTVYSLFILLFLFCANVVTVVAKEGFENGLTETIDDLVQDLTFKYASIQSDQFWHPYIYGTGNEHRESKGYISRLYFLTIGIMSSSNFVLVKE